MPVFEGFMAGSGGRPAADAGAPLPENIWKMLVCLVVDLVILPSAPMAYLAVDCSTTAVERTAAAATPAEALPTSAPPAAPSLAPASLSLPL